MAEQDDDRELTEEEQAAADAAAAKKKKRKLIFIVGGLILVLVLLGGALAAWFLWPETSEENVDSDEAVEEVEPPEQAAIYYPLREKFIVNYDVRGRQRFLQVEVTLMLRDNGVIPVIELHMPRVRNDLIMLLSGQVFEDLQTPEGKELLRQDALSRVQDILEQEIGKPGVEQVLFTSFVMQ